MKDATGKRGRNVRMHSANGGGKRMVDKGKIVRGLRRAWVGARGQRSRWVEGGGEGNAP